MVYQGATQSAMDPAVAFAQLWSHIKQKNPSLERVASTPPSHEARSPNRKRKSNMKDFLDAARAKEMDACRDLLLPEKYRNSEAPWHGDQCPCCKHKLGMHQSGGASELSKDNSYVVSNLQHGSLAPFPDLQQEISDSVHIKTSKPSKLAVQEMTGKITLPDAGVRNSDALPPSELKLNKEDFALAEACLDGLAEQDSTPASRSLRAQCEAAARALQRLGVDSTDKGASLLLDLLEPLGLGGDNITPAQMRALLEALGHPASELQGASPESLRVRLRTHLLGQEAEPPKQQFADRSDLWPERSRQPPSGGCPIFGSPWETSRHQPSLFKRSGAAQVMTMYPVTSSASVPSLPSCAALLKSPHSGNESRTAYHNHKSAQREMSLPALDSLFSCKTLRHAVSTSYAGAKGYSNAQKRKHRQGKIPGKIRYGDRRLPPILVEVT
eukprot:gnl/MRDRNA2_/MRDRNA2_106590_c0_seq1.p1 gnl/MRDRNA2_/MRDRNA2_106590_c0~~gnl/MRDRNA2_/MRDRNA2_106590_c0_seq1.p1  ORF type:complete len:441 (-),score=77.90 gnl/MRDRNA2_/MRDRNA2_106590_c0_seq1:84-1406(-)